MATGPRSKHLLEKIIHTLESGEMLQPFDAVLAGISGGPDSICLLDVLTVLSRRMNLRIGVAHLNHTLRLEEADRDAAFVRSMAARYGLSYYEKKIDIRNEARKSRISIEEAGRQHRHTFFHEIASTQGFSKIALGHHRDDNAELFLINLLRGSGPEGLSGMAPVRDKLVRPLIHLDRGEIMDYLAENQLAYRIDASNADPVYLRNRIRHELLPLLKEHYNPRMEQTLNRTADILRAEQNWLADQVESAMEQFTTVRNEQERVLRIADLKKLHKALLRRILRESIRRIKGNLRGISHTQVESAVGLIHQNRSRARIDLPGRILLVKADDQLIIRQEMNRLRASLPYPSPPVYRYRLELENLPAHLWIPEIRKTLVLSPWRGSTLPDMHDAAGKGRVFFDLDRISPPLTARNPEPGDRFVPLGMKGSQKIKDFFINNHVPRAERPYHPVIESSRGIIWLAGQRISETVKVRPETRRILQGEIIPGPSLTA